MQAHQLSLFWKLTFRQLSLCFSKWTAKKARSSFKFHEYVPIIAPLTKNPNLIWSHGCHLPLSLHTPASTAPLESVHGSGNRCGNFHFLFSCSESNWIQSLLWYLFGKSLLALIKWVGSLISVLSRHVCVIQTNCCNWWIGGNFSRFLGLNKRKNRTFTSREVSSLTVLRNDRTRLESLDFCCCKTLWSLFY